MFARAAAAEVAARDENPPLVTRVVERECGDRTPLGVVAPVAEKIVAESLAFGRFQEARRNDLIGVDVLRLDGHRPRSEGREFGNSHCITRLFFSSPFLASA